ncbi:MAG: ABC transporter substrate-binding protein [Rhodospirillaceae bacterium]|nr:ABC transporter substrate-binding protein [Rhodospirillaceae bacterium]
MALTLFEPFRAVFYTPFYAAHALGAYGAEGVDVNTVTSGADVTVSGLIAGDTDVTWGGPMRIQYTYDQQPDCAVVSFCEVVTRDPFFLVGREPKPNFKMADLMDIRLATVSEVNTPWLCLQEDLRRADLDPDQVTRVLGNTMAENDAALRAGEIDVIQVFQPFPEQLVADGAGHIWYAAATRGATSYTTLSTLQPPLDAPRATLLQMTRAIYRTQKWLHATADADVAATIADFFPDMPQEMLTACIARYRSLGLWGVNPILPRDGFDRLQASGHSGGLFTVGAAYETCVDNSLAEEVIAADPPSM